MKWSTAKAEIKCWGLGRFAYDCILSRLKTWLTLCSVNVRPLYRDPDVPELAANQEVRVAALDELIAASADPVNDLDPAWIRAAHDRGERCVAVFEGGKIVSSVWRAFAPSPHEKGLWLHFGPQCFYSFKAFTPPAYRRRRLQHATCCKLDPDLLDQGYRYSIGFIETHNYPSLISARKRGNRRVGWAGYFTVFGRVISFRSPGAKKYGFGFFPAGGSTPEGVPSHQASK